MFKRTLFILFFSFVAAIIVVSYTEKKQIFLFMPLRSFFYIPHKQIPSISVASIDSIPAKMPFKQSKDGYYINPWQSSAIVYKTAISVLKNDRKCDGIAPDERSRLLEFANFFLKTAEIRKYSDIHFAVWPYPIHFTYNLKPGWISGLAQGNIAVVLSAASLCSNQSSLRKISSMAINSFQVPVDQGGVLVVLDEGYWFEEYAQAGVTPPRVLNGHIYAVLALRELRNFDVRAARLYLKGVATIYKTIHYFDAITWSYYDRVGQPADNSYQQIHARQMLELYEATGENIFLEYHRKFVVQLWFPFSSLQRFIMKPTRFLGFLLVVNTIIIFILTMVLFSRKKSTLMNIF